MKSIYKKLLLGLGVAIVLALAFWYGGNAPGLRGWTAAAPSPSATIADANIANEIITGASAAPEAVSPPPTTSPSSAASLPPSDAPSPSPSSAPRPTKPTSTPEPTPTPPTTEAPLPSEPRGGEVGDTAYTCTLSVRCDALLEHLDLLAAEKKELVPEDGILFPATEVTFYEGESVFDVLLREMKSNHIHMEFVDTPLYNSAYIEGIGNLYEFDCGERSGWVYRVNGASPDYGCSRYTLQDGDMVEWVYTCAPDAQTTGLAAGGG